jgi:DNA-binding transcriptional LysR family regulator
MCKLIVGTVEFLYMDGISLHHLRCLDAVVQEGGLQAAAGKLFRTHPSIAVALRSLEAQLGFALFDRGGYRLVLTPAGRAFHERAQSVLREFGTLRAFAAQLAAGEESALRVVVGDLCPLPATLELLRGFFLDCPATRLDLYFEAISGPWERLADNAADLILHHIDKSDPTLEFIALGVIRLIPVAAPTMPGLIDGILPPERLREAVQCVIRDTARHSPPRDYYLVEGARQVTVSDQLMKKEVILQGMGWGHMPEFLVAAELREGRLTPLAGAHLRGGSVELVAARRRDRPHGPVAQRLWRYLGERVDGLTI